MTVSEFKHKYPQWAHLEGDALWNTMEDIMLTQQSLNRGPLRDWRGNEIRHGHSICLIRTWYRPILSGGTMIFIDPINNETQTLGSWKMEEKEGPCWEVGPYYDVYDIDGKLVFDMIIGDIKVIATVNTLRMDIDPPTIILAIKGISDTKP